MSTADLLFVYGSLVTRLAHPQGERLRREADLIGPARLQGLLFRVTWYPGATLSPHPSDQVHGEVYRLHNPAAAFQWLDAYEGLQPDQTSVAPTDEYARQICTVQRATGSAVKAHVYLYRKDTTLLPQIQTGIWTG